LSFSRLVSRWKGLALSLVAVLATVWLGLSGQLGLYIHPRYFVFTLIMAGLAVVLIVGAFAVMPGADEHGHGQDEHGHPGEAVPRRPRWAIGGAALTILTVAASVVALLVVPPTTLTSAAVEQRSLNGSANTLSNAGGQAFSGGSISGDTSSYTVKDWATLIRQGADAESLDGTVATLTGFVTADPDDPDDVFFVARFVITCCAVDAQPVGVPVYQPGWSSGYPVDSWITVTGGFVPNPSVLSTAITVVQPDSISAVPRPADPYVY
jgi:uncharacterized repeat protein (TIGR03943 family)